MKKLVGILLFIAANATTVWADWQNICPSSDISYCRNVGRQAANGDGNPPALRGVVIGKIIGVAWKQKGALINARGETSPRDAFYYVLDDGWGKPFLRQCREIDAK